MAAKRRRQTGKPGKANASKSSPGKSGPGKTGPGKTGPGKTGPGKTGKATASRVRRLGGNGATEAGATSNEAIGTPALTKSARQFWYGKDLKALALLATNTLATNTDQAINAAGDTTDANTIDSGIGGTSGGESDYGDALTTATSTVRSLGSPPLSGRETIAEHYFDAAYLRASVMAEALLNQVSHTT